MNRVRRSALRPVVAMVLSALLLAGCPKERHVSIVRVDDALNPEFCVSELPDCGGSGIQLTEFFVATVDDTGKYTDAHGIREPMWIIEPTEDTILNRFVYGSAPVGWHETLPSKPLRVGQWYTVGTQYFRFDRAGSRVQVELLSPEEYRKRIEHR